MKRTRSLLLLGLLASLALGWSLADAPPLKEPSFQNGDIVFQSSKSGQSWAIQLATGSKFSHVGMLFEKDGEWQVLEAVQPVRWTSLEDFRSHGDGGKISVRRLADSSKLTEEVVAAMRKEGVSHVGKDYDVEFDWNDDEMYCSELVWKVYQRTLGIELGELKPLKEYSLKHPAVKKQLKRYGGQLPLEHPMIAPGAIFESPLLVTVVDE